MLSPDEVREFERILITAFPNQPVLERMVYYSLEKTNLNIIVQPTDLRQMVFKLIQWVTDGNKFTISTLANGALKENKGSLEFPDLQLFCLLLLLDEAGFTKEECKAFYHRVMPSPLLDDKKLDQNFSRYDMLIKLQVMPKGTDTKMPPLFSFVLEAKHHEKAKHLKERFENWLNLVNKANKYDVDFKTVKQHYPTTQSCKCLAVIVKPIGKSEKRDDFEVKIIPDQMIDHIIDFPAIQYSELNKLGQFILEAFNRLEYKGFETEGATIEFFLPIALLSEGVDQYRLPSLIVPFELGYMHPVIVRSIDRMENPYCYGLVKKKWDKLMNCKSDDRPGFVRIDAFDSLASNVKLDYELSYNQHACLGITHVLDEVPRHIELLNKIISGGIPIVLWIRPIESCDDDKGHLEKIEILRSSDPNLLPQLIHQERRKLYDHDETEMYYYTLIWDNPYRAPSISSLRA